MNDDTLIESKRRTWTDRQRGEPGYKLARKRQRVRVAVVGALSVLVYLSPYALLFSLSPWPFWPSILATVGIASVQTLAVFFFLFSTEKFFNTIDS